MNAQSTIIQFGWNCTERLICWKAFYPRLSLLNSTAHDHCTVTPFALIAAGSPPGAILSQPTAHVLVPMAASPPSIDAYR